MSKLNFRDHLPEFLALVMDMVFSGIAEARFPIVMSLLILVASAIFGPSETLHWLTEAQWTWRGLSIPGMLIISSWIIGWVFLFSALVPLMVLVTGTIVYIAALIHLGLKRFGL